MGYLVASGEHPNLMANGPAIPASRYVPIAIVERLEVLVECLLLGNEVGQDGVHTQILGRWRLGVFWRLVDAIDQHAEPSEVAAIEVQTNAM